MRTAQTERGGKTALLVIDVQNAVMAESFEADQVVGRIDYPDTTSRVVSHSEAFAPIAATA